MATGFATGAAAFLGAAFGAGAFFGAGFFAAGAAFFGAGLALAAGLAEAAGFFTVLAADFAGAGFLAGFAFALVVFAIVPHLKTCVHRKFCIIKYLLGFLPSGYKYAIQERPYLKCHKISRKFLNLR
ncbi:MAG TPA: hypothetical protein PLW48_03725 [Alphaproteobacteria bacterium]|nr:hypothetical protein [Alphaproteobacteria bacterium]